MIEGDEAVRFLFVLKNRAHNYRLVPQRLQILGKRKRVGFCSKIVIREETVNVKCNFHGIFSIFSEDRLLARQSDNVMINVVEFRNATVLLFKIW
jgi:hypothetical protein